MKKILTIVTLAFLTLPAMADDEATANAGDDTESCAAVWTDVGITKVLPHNFSLDLELGYRTLDWLNQTDRMNVGLGVNYKVGKNFKFSLGYDFIYKHFPTEVKATEIAYKYEDADGLDQESPSMLNLADDAYDEWEYKGYNVTNSVHHAFWNLRHRVHFDIAADKRFWKTLRIGLRERYQFTHQPSKDIDRTKYRTKYRDPYKTDPSALDYNYDEVTDTIINDLKTKSVKNRHQLRSKLKFSIDKKGWKCEPYASCEFFNDLASSWHLDKIRAAVGVDYSINKQHKIGIGYVFNHENDDDGDQDIHAISVGYHFKF